MTLHAAPPLDAENPVQWSLITSSYRIPAADPLSSFKTLNKLTHVMARVEAVEQGADEALLINTNGEVAETASGNLFWVYQDKICTVPTGRGVLPGITRAVVLEICQTLGLPTNKRVIKPEALRNSEGIFITQSALGIVPVTSFDGEPVAPSPLVEPDFARLQRNAGPAMKSADGRLIIWISHHQIVFDPIANRSGRRYFEVETGDDEHVAPATGLKIERPL